MNQPLRILAHLARRRREGQRVLVRVPALAPRKPGEQYQITYRLIRH